jgi:hypothetical protein
MKTHLLLGTAAIALFGLAGPQVAHASYLPGAKAATSAPVMTLDSNSFQLASKGSGEGGSGHDAGDDNGGRHDSSDDSRHDSGDDGDDDESGSGRSKKRIPGGSGCDDAGDVAEHGSCGG